MVLPKLIAALLLVLSLGAAPVASAEPADKATLYLRAWSFKDYAAMRDLTAGTSRPPGEETAFFGAAAKLPAPATEPEIVSRSPRAGAPAGTETVYFTYAPAAGGTPVRGSIIAGPDGVVHPELMAAATQVMNASAAAVGSEQKTVEGETADSILEKMQEATKAAETLQSNVSIRGSMMGVTVNETAQLHYKAPNKIRLQSKSFVMNADGTRSILYLPPANIYMNMADFGDFELAPGIGTTAAEMKDKYEITLASKGEVNGEAAFELRMKSPTAGGKLPMGMGQGSGRMTMWVSATTWLPVRAAVDGMNIDYRNMQVNAGDIDDSIFDFKPPAGATAFSLGGLLGALGGAGSLPGLDE